MYTQILLCIARIDAHLHPHTCIRTSPLTRVHVPCIDSSTHERMRENLLGHACTLVNMATWSYREGNCGMRTALHQSDSFIHRQPRHRSPVDAINSIPRVQTAMSWAVGCTLGHHETLAFPTHPQVRQLCESSKTLNHADCQRRVVTTAEPAPAARRESLF